MICCALCGYSGGIYSRMPSLFLSLTYPLSHYHSRTCPVLSLSLSQFIHVLCIEYCAFCMCSHCVVSMCMWVCLMMPLSVAQKLQHLFRRPSSPFGGKGSACMGQPARLDGWQGPLLPPLLPRQHQDRSGKRRDSHATRFRCASGPFPASGLVTCMGSVCSRVFLFLLCVYVCVCLCLCMCVCMCVCVCVCVCV